MAYLQLMTDEEIIYETLKNFTLTTHRIRSTDSTLEKKEVVSIMLEKISSIAISSRNYLVFLILGILLILFSFWGFANSYNQGLDFIILVLGIISIVVYALTRKSIVIISSDGGHAAVLSSMGLSHESVIEIINKIEVAKNDRMRYLNSIK